MGVETVKVAAEWLPSLACFCPSCKLHINILRVPAQAGTVRNVTLTVGAAYEGDLLVLICPNCGATVGVASVKAGGEVRLAGLVSDGTGGAAPTEAAEPV